MQDQATFVVSNGESETWMKMLVLTYASARDYEMWNQHTTASIIETEVLYEGHVWRAVPYAHPTVYPRLELKSSTTTTVVAVPVSVFVKLVAAINKQWEENLQVMKSHLIGLANGSTKDYV